MSVIANFLYLFDLAKIDISTIQIAPDRDFHNAVDCCDGSDESPGKCPSTCDEAGTEYRAALKAKSTGMKLGLKAKEKYISKAVTRKKEWQQEVKKLSSEKTAIQESVDSLKGAAA